MRTTRASRLLYDAVSSTVKSPYVCKSCRQNAVRPSLSLSRTEQLRYATSESLSVTEKLRQRFWPRKDELVENSDAEEGFDLQKDDKPNYKPAETWDGLEHYGHLGDWWDIPPSERKRDSYQAFTARYDTAKKRADLISCLHRAITEYHLGHKASRNKLKNASYAPAQARINIVTNQSKEIVSAKPASESDNEILKAPPLLPMLPRLKDQEKPFLDQAISKASKATSAFRATVKRLNEGRLDTFQATEEFLSQYLRDKPLPKPKRDREVLFYYEVQSEDFLNCRLPERDQIKAKILARFSELAGIRIPDPLLNHDKTLRDIIDHLSESVKEKPKTLTETLLQEQAIMQNKNLKIMKERESLVLKEREVGRLKLIEAELASRGLPALEAPWKPKWLREREQRAAKTL